MADPDGPPARRTIAASPDTVFALPKASIDRTAGLDIRVRTKHFRSGRRPETLSSTSNDLEFAAWFPSSAGELTR